MFLWFISVALANTWAPVDQGFLSPARSDAPTDGVLVYAANYAPSATVMAGPGAPMELYSEVLTGVGSAPHAALYPPEAGWQSGQTYEVSVAPYDEGEAPTTLSFSVGAVPAAAAPGG